jgi:hypothetical protein
LAGTPAEAFDGDGDITVVIEDDGETVRTLDSGDIAIDQPDGGVVIQLNPQRFSAANDDEDPKKFYQNLVEKIDPGRLSVIAEELFEAVTADDASRSEWLADRADRMELLGLKSDDPRSGDGASAVDGQSVVTNPLLLEACLKGWANAQAELLPAEGPCKIASYGDPTSQKDDELGEQLQKDMNYYLTSIATEFAPQTSHMLLWGCYFGGSGFKKVYTHPLKKRPYSEKVAPEHLIVSDAMTDFDECERITHQISMRQSVMKRYQMKGIYRKIALAPPSGDAANQVDEEIAATQGVSITKDRPEDMPYTLWEIQCELDLEQFAPGEYRNEGIPLPYLVTMDKDSHVILAIRRDWKPEDPDCNRKKMYVKYPYVPGPGFYGTGLAGILGNASAAMTAAWRLSLDTAMYANFPSFLMAKLGGRQNTSDFRLAPGTGQPIETNGLDISKVVKELPYKDVTTGMMALIDKITEQSKAVGGAPDIPVGEGTANIPVGTMLAHVEQSTKVMAAAHKGQHRAMDEELSLIADLFRENPESFWKGNKNSIGFWSPEKLLEALNTRALVPKSDPNVPSHIHRVMKAVALVELSGTPLGQAKLNPDETIRRVLVAMREDPAGLIKPDDPNPQPTPEMITAQAKAKEADNKAKKTDVDLEIAKIKMPVEQMKAKASIDGKSIELARTLAANEDERQANATKERIAQGEFHLQTQEVASESQRRADQTQIDFMKLGVEKEKVGLGHRQADITEQQHAQQTQLQATDQQHQHQVEEQKIGLEGAKIGMDGQAREQEHGLAEKKLGLDQQKADTDTYSALNPPKPAGGGASSSKRKRRRKK